MAGEQLNKESKDLEEFQILMDWMEQQGRTETAQDFLQVAKYLEEMQTQLSVMTKELQEVNKVRIIDGPFKDMEGTIESVDMKTQKLNVNVDLFGQVTKVEVDLQDIESI